jgi:predicted aminopeptidase
MFHELAHQQLYVAGDTVFSESFATLVEQEGVSRWLASRGDTAALCKFLSGLEHQREVHALLDQARARLRAVYSGQLPDDLRRAARTAEIERLRASYRELRARWPGPPYFDAWFEGAINNAFLGALSAYDRDVGRLRVMLDGEKGELPAFYRRAAQLARLSAVDRAAVLAEIRSPTWRPPGAVCADPG